MHVTVIHKREREREREGESVLGNDKTREGEGVREKNMQEQGSQWSSSRVVEWSSSRVVE